MSTDTTPPARPAPGMVLLIFLGGFLCGWVVFVLLMLYHGLKLVKG